MRRSLARIGVTGLLLAVSPFPAFAQIDPPKRVLFGVTAGIGLLTSGTGLGTSTAVDGLGPLGAFTLGGMFTPAWGLEGEVAYLRVPDSYDYKGPHANNVQQLQFNALVRRSHLSSSVSTLDVVAGGGLLRRS